MALDGKFLGELHYEHLRLCSVYERRLKITTVMRLFLDIIYSKLYVISVLRYRSLIPIT